MRYPTLTELQDKLRFRRVDRRCDNCRYFRVHKTGSITTDCLLLGRTLAIDDNAGEAICLSMHRICDGWKKRPSTWEIQSFGVDNSPYWKDPYIPRATQERLRGQVMKGK